MRRGRLRRARTAASRAPARAPRARSSARGVLPATAAPAPANRSAPSSAVNVISGCSENRSCGARTSRPVAPEQWPTIGPARDSAPRPAAISRVGHAQAARRRNRSRIGAAPERPAETSRPRSRRRARHGRAQRGHARRSRRAARTSRDAQGRGVQGAVPVPALRYRSEKRKLCNCDGGPLPGGYGLRSRIPRLTIGLASSP